MSASLKSGYRGSTHTDVNTTSLIWRIADKTRELDLQTVVTEREAKVKVHPDILAVGYRKFESSSLATFNRKIADLKEGISCHSELESDEIAPCQVLDDEADDDDSEPIGEVSDLHDDD